MMKLLTFFVKRTFDGLNKKTRQSFKTLINKLCSNDSK